MSGVYVEAVVADEDAVVDDDDAVIEYSAVEFVNYDEIEPIDCNLMNNLKASLR
jgi:hypothetical protein